jgi:anti-anti-sigma factor
MSGHCVLSSRRIDPTSLKTALQCAFAANDRVILDLEGVEFMSLAAVRQLLVACNDLRDNQTLELTHVPHQLTRLLNILGVADLLPTYDSLQVSH